jgi:predicted nucleotidyltransferase
MTIGGIKIRYIAPEDLIIQKIVAGRPQYLDDVKWLVRKVAALELDEVRRWLRQFEEALKRPLITDLDGALRH